MEGDPVRGEFRGDPSAGAVITLYRSGTLTERTIASDEYFEADAVHVVNVPNNNDVNVYVGTSSTPAVGESILRGTVANNSRMYAKYTPESMAFVRGSSPRVKSSVIGNVDVNLTGRIRRA